MSQDKVDLSKTPIGLKKLGGPSITVLLESLCRGNTVTFTAADGVKYKGQITGLKHPSGPNSSKPYLLTVSMYCETIIWQGHYQTPDTYKRCLQVLHYDANLRQGEISLRPLPAPPTQPQPHLKPYPNSRVPDDVY